MRHDGKLPRALCCQIVTHCLVVISRQTPACVFTHTLAHTHTQTPPIVCVNCTVWDHRSDHSCVGYASLSGSLGSSAPPERLRHCHCQTRQPIMRALLAVRTPLKHSPPSMHHFLSFTFLHSPDIHVFFYSPTLSMSVFVCLLTGLAGTTPLCWGGRAAPNAVVCHLGSSAVTNKWSFSGTPQRESC